MNKWPAKLIVILILIVATTIILSYLQSPKQVTAGIKIDRTAEYYNLLRAVSALEEEKNHDAIDICKAILRTNPYNNAANRILARAYLRDGDVLKAEEILQQTLSRSNDASTLSELGEVFIAQNKIDHAIRALERSYDLDPNMPKTVRLLAELYREQGEIFGAKIMEERLDKLKK